MVGKIMVEQLRPNKEEIDEENAGSRFKQVKKVSATISYEKAIVTYTLNFDRKMMMRIRIWDRST